ncbi:phosphohydrolase [Candidatus Aerophobetes bacterium]|uniref:Phosphohydrolase n=1 Tax=Aerophobetes bacterium TaxID=2030807 RepID=A0A2A4X2T5_UNCAE|nr:MAG: phosphohydrolase [Candidatus Aerophobetes bacterium]
MSYKRIYDPVHRFIEINPYEDLLIRSGPFERLRYIHQCGATFFVYPGATHKRFEHSLGVMHVATMIYETLINHVEREVFENSETLYLLDAIPKKGTYAYTYWKQILRFASLCHDIGHLPFSHVAEKMLLKEDDHEHWTYKIIMSSYMDPVFAAFEKQAKNQGMERSVKEDVAKVALGPKNYLPNSIFSPFESALASILIGDFFGADRIDYLLRDAQQTGLSYGQFDYHQLIQMLRFIPVNKAGEHCIDLGILENGLESCESLLLARHFMFKKIYNYPRVKAYEFHLARFIQKSFSRITSSIHSYLDTSDIEVLYAIKKAKQDPSHIAHFDALCLKGGADPFKAIVLPFALTHDHLIEFQNKYNIKESDISWSISPLAGQYMAMNMPIIHPDKKISFIPRTSSVQIPSIERSWLYLSNAHQDNFSTFSQRAIPEVV